MTPMRFHETTTPLLRKFVRLEAFRLRPAEDQQIIVYHVGKGRMRLGVLGLLLIELPISLDSHSLLCSSPTP